MTLSTIETLEAQAIAAATCAATSYADVLRAAADDLSNWLRAHDLTVFQRQELERLAVLLRTVQERMNETAQGTP